MSVDPVAANASNGSNFNRYWYGNDNPYKYVDPDGRYSCDAASCPAAHAGYAAIQAARANPNNTARVNQKLDSTLELYGAPGEANGVYIQNAALEGLTAGQAATYSVPSEPGGLMTVISLDVDQLTGDAARLGTDFGKLVGGTMAHEGGGHGVTQRGGGHDGTWAEYNLDEIKSYTLQAEYFEASGINPYGYQNADGTLNMKEIGKAADRSTNAICAKENCP